MSITYQEKECEVCGAWFTPVRVNAKYCPDCRKMQHGSFKKQNRRYSKTYELMDMDVKQNPLHANAATVKKILLPMVRKNISAVHPAHPNTGSHIPSVHTVESA